MAPTSLPPATTVADVLALRGESGWLSPPLRAFSKGGRVAGRAVTIRVVPEPPADGVALEPLYEVLSRDLTGAVVVVAGAEDVPGAVWGQILSRAAASRGAVAAVIDGAARDRALLDGEGLPVWARHEVTVGAVRMAYVDAVDRAVNVAGVTVSPGDVILIDTDGVVALAGDTADSVLTDAARYADAEKAVLRELQDGSALVDAYQHKREVSRRIRDDGQRPVAGAGSYQAVRHTKEETDMPTPNLGSLLVGSSNADEMKKWYRRCFDAKENEMGAFQFGDIQFFVEEHSEVSGPTKDPARVIINLDVDDCRSLETHLRDQGVRWIREVEQMPFGLIGTVADPDGNYVQIIQWGAGSEDHKDT